MTEREWYFYILRCKDNTLYSGITVDVPERVKAHNIGKGAKYTAGRRPVKLVYQEVCPNTSEARKREARVKRLTKAQKERLIAYGL
ncbi:MAG: GIY-YIG nuclease family protein [Dehalococcoidales bacterium]|nr:GIY-YIG nuclease family protein [Dehalococcoidales bacterium]